MKTIKLKRVYEAAEAADGFRVLVDRLWPRGMKKETAKVDLWFKEVAPSNELRKWFGHDPAKWPEFEKRYLNEIKANSATAQQLVDLAKEKKQLTIVYGAKDEEHNQAVVLQKWLQKRV